MAILVFIFPFYLVIAAQCTELDVTIDDYEIIDGIRVLKEKIVQNENKDEMNDKKDVKGIEEDEEMRDSNGDDVEEEEEMYEDVLNEDDATEEDDEITRHLPNDCHGNVIYPLNLPCIV